MRVENEFNDDDMDHDVLEHCDVSDVGQIETDMDTLR